MELSGVICVKGSLLELKNLELKEYLVTFRFGTRILRHESIPVLDFFELQFNDIYAPFFCAGINRPI